jgi:hypothetical protein
LKFLKIDYKNIEKQLKADYASNESVIAKAAFKKLVETTPVDTGKARDGWKLTKKSKGFLIENPVSYIKKLNTGSSKQAPAMFIEQALLDTKGIKPDSISVAYDE